jgi:dienelactone hydrolase
VTLALILVAAIGVAGWLYLRYSSARWVRNEAIPQIQRLVAQDDYVGAFDLVRKAVGKSPDDPQLKQRWQEVSVSVSMNTDPPGARVSYRDYGKPEMPWRPAGQTPLRDVPLPMTQIAVRVEKEGFVPYEFATLSGLLGGQTIALLRPSERPEGTTPVPASARWMPPSGMTLPDYFIDQFEVTNRQFQRFVDAGGYNKQEYWREPFKAGSRDRSFKEAMALFRDRTGRPGPSQWELGVFPKEHGDYPVGGVSWFEAAAYCKFANKSLPTIHHWRKAAGFNNAPNAILLHSNFMSSGPARVGAYPGVSCFGAFDMAGNVKEWCRNEASGKRAILGGAWNEPSYKFASEDAQDPFAREPAFGFRCAVYTTPPPTASLAPMQPSRRDYSKEKPVSDDSFQILRRLYEYDKTPIEGRTERVDESNADWRLEKVSYRAAYDGERIPAYLYIPRNAKPPYQAVVWFPGGYAMGLRNSEGAIGTQFFSFLPHTGRAVLYPIYKGTFERRSVGGGEGPNAFRDSMIHYSKDLSRSVDYLESRPDIQGANLAYFGLSTGGFYAPIFLAVEPRFKAAILAAGGLFRDPVAPEVDTLNFAPRARTPVLLLNGRYDFYDPPELQQALFRSLGASPADKRYVLSESGHLPPLQDIMREVLNWLDRYLGPVQQ